jgi:hypothetical protein
METSRFQGRGDCFFQGRDMGIDPGINSVDPLPQFVPLGLLARLAGLFILSVLLFKPRGQDGK